VSRMAATGAAAAVAVAALAALLVVVVTRGSDGGRPAGSRADETTAAEAEAPTVSVARTHLGRVLVDRRGHTLYLFTRDTRGRSACTGSCTRVWPPVLVAARPLAGPGVSAAKLGTLRRGNDALQVEYAGHPLYALTADTGPGQTSGQGFEGAWFVVSPAGRGIGAARAKRGSGY
jgi:predicted lipoprotein with Yx(FWY)xxD motif